MIRILLFVFLVAQTFATNSLADDRPNILLIISEDNGPELGCYGDKYAQTPNLDRFATEGVRFETAYVTQAVCSPSRGTIFTGLYPHQNGQIGLATHQFAMFRAWPTTYSILKNSGYRTGLLGKTHVNPEKVIENWVDFRAIRSSNFGKKNLQDYSEKSAEFINASDQPFFLTVNFPDAHWPVQNEVQGRPKKILKPGDVGPMPYIGFDNERLHGHLTGFYNCMSRLDECVGELLDVLESSGKAKNTLVIYIGDHGAQFARGKVFVTEGGLRIPFMVRWPGKAKPGMVSKQMVSTVDLLPTIVSAAGAEVPEGLPGFDLAPVLERKQEPLRKYLFGERNCDAATLHFPQRAIRDTRYKLIKSLLPDQLDPAAHHCLINGASNFRGSPTYDELKATGSKQTQQAYETWLTPPLYQLYDLENDPHEFVNLAADPKLADVKQRLTKRLEQWQLETDDKLRFPELLAKLTAEIHFCLKNKIRSPKSGWKYIDYLAPERAKKKLLQQEIPIKVRMIWDAAPHNAFTDLIHWRDEFYCAFRIGSGHVPGANGDDGRIQVIRSGDNGKSWASVAIVTEPDIDLRDPKLSITPEGRLMLLMGGSNYDGTKLVDRAPRVAFLTKGKKQFSKTQTLNIDPKIAGKNDWLWRLSWHDGIGYGVVYQAGETPWGLNLVSTKDGINYTLVHTFKSKGKPNESTVRFDADGQMHLVIRNEDSRRIGHYGRSKAPFTKWDWNPIKRRLGGPNLIQLPDGTWLLGTREYGETARTVLGELENDGSFKKLITFPSGGDTSYPGMLIHKDELWFSYYSSHQGRTSIYLATIRLADLAKTKKVTTQKPNPNVLFIAVDDWNDWVGCLGHEQAITPNVDRLAAQGLLFTNAHCAAPVCNPSRVAVLTGLRPDTTGVFENSAVMRKKVPNVVTLPQHFRANGYEVAGGGKIFHDVPPHCHDAASWDEYFWWNKGGPKGGKHNGSWRSPYSIAPDPEPPARPANKITALTKRNFDWGAVDQPVNDWPDHQVATWASKFLGKDHDKPFFLAVGIFRPHVPWFNPRKYVDLHPIGDIELPIVREDDNDDLGKWARNRAEDSASKHQKVIELGEWPAAVQAYLASISFADANVGRVLDALESSKYKDNTIVVLWSDHGYHLGEKGHWHKRTLWERATRVPVIVRVPGMTKANTRCDEAVNLLDLYPTLVESCGLPENKKLEGESLVPLLQDPTADRATPSVTTYLADNHAVRDERWRYISYGTGEQELYDHSVDPNEWENLAGQEDYATVISQLKAWIPEKDLPLSGSNGGRRNETLAQPVSFREIPAQQDPQTVFEQRDIPAGTPLEGHGKDAKKYGYRIPSLLVTQKGTILAFAERRIGLHDHAQNDIVLKRSTDDGQTWGEEIVAFEDGMNSINDPLTVQLENGRILLMFGRFPYGRHARTSGWIKMADLGYDDPESNILTFVCHSDDDGLTWSQPIDISRQVKAPHLLNANTPGSMIQLAVGPHKGRIVTGLWGTVPIHKDGKESREWQIVVAHSDDHGKTWKRTEPLKDISGKGYPNECQVVESANGDIVLISRNQGGDAFRKKTISRDGGDTWDPIDIDKTLPSVACMGSVIKGPVKPDGTWDLYASFPSNKGRTDGQVAVSTDNGATWKIVKVIKGSFAYSATQISPDKKSLLCFYEDAGYKKITLLTIPLSELDIRRRR